MHSSVLSPIIGRYNSLAICITTHSGMAALILHLFPSLDRSFEPPSSRALCGPQSLSALTHKFFAAKYTHTHYVISVSLACMIRRDLTHICTSITVWPALYDCPHARAQFSTKRDFLLQCSSIVSIRGISSSTLLHGICFHSVSLILQTVYTPRLRGE